MILTCLTFSLLCQDCTPGNFEWSKKAIYAEDKNGRQHQRVDRPESRRIPKDEKYHPRGPYNRPIYKAGEVTCSFTRHCLPFWVAGSVNSQLSQHSETRIRGEGGGDGSPASLRDLRNSALELNLLLCFQMVKKLCQSWPQKGSIHLTYLTIEFWHVGLFHHLHWKLILKDWKN